MIPHTFKQLDVKRKATDEGSAEKKGGWEFEAYQTQLKMIVLSFALSFFFNFVIRDVKWWF